MTTKIGIIGGSGLYKMEQLNVLNEIYEENSYGFPSAPIIHGTIDGIDVSKALKGGALPDRAITWALSAVSEMQFAVRRGDWKMLSDGDLQPRQLFNLKEDPLEFFNLIAENPSVVKRLDQDLNEAVSSFRSDPFLPDQKMKFRFAQ